MKRLLVIHHAPTAGVRQLLEAVLEGASDPEIIGVEIQTVPALAWAQGTQDETAILQADGYLLLTPANFGYMSGALQHVFDSTFLKIGGSLSADGSAGGTLHDAGRSRPRRPYGLIVHGRYDTTGAVRSVEGIVRALGWQSGGKPLEALGDVTAHHLVSARELGATLAALLMT